MKGLLNDNEKLILAAQQLRNVAQLLEGSVTVLTSVDSYGNSSKKAIIEYPERLKFAPH